MEKKMPYEEILEKYEIKSMDNFNKLYKSIDPKDPLNKYIAIIQHNGMGSIADVYTFDDSKIFIDDHFTDYFWILPLKKAVEFVKVYPEKKSFCIIKDVYPDAYEFLKKENLL